MNNILKKTIQEVKKDMNSMKYFIYQMNLYKIKPTIIFDIGSYNAAHLKELCDNFDVPVLDAFAFECHPGMLKHCSNRGVNVLPFAISNFDGEAKFNAIDLTQDCHHGCSSLYNIGRPHNVISVQVRRIDTLMNKGVIPINPQVVKIDVEGKSFEVLESFGKALQNVQIFHVETEIRELYKGQRYEKDIIEFMKTNNFRIVHSLDIELQRDHIFLNNKIG